MTDHGHLNGRIDLKPKKGTRIGSILSTEPFGTILKHLEVLGISRLKLPFQRDKP